MRSTDRLVSLEKLLARKSVGRILRKFLRPPNTVANQLDVREAYRLWASTYDEETLLCYLDSELARTMLQGLPHAQLLDAGCGAGSRIRDIPGAVGIDLSPEMIAVGGLHNIIVAGD